MRRLTWSFAIRSWVRCILLYSPPSREPCRHLPSIHDAKFARAPRNRRRTTILSHTHRYYCPAPKSANCKIPDRSSRCLLSSVFCSACACRMASWSPNRWISNGIGRSRWNVRWTWSTASGRGSRSSPDLFVDYSYFCWRIRTGNTLDWVLRATAERTIHGTHHHSRDLLRRAAKQMKSVKGERIVLDFRQDLRTHENDVETTPQLVGWQSHYLMVRILEEGLTRDSYFDMWRQRVALTQITELTQFPTERAFICPRHPVNTFSTFLSTRPWIVKCCFSRIVIDEESFPGRRVSHFPAWRQWSFIH